MDFESFGWDLDDLILVWMFGFWCAFRLFLVDFYASAWILQMLVSMLLIWLAFLLVLHGILMIWLGSC